MEEKVPKRVLLVDDEASTRKLFGEVLADQGYHVVLAADGEEALERFRETRPDVVITDVRMPKLDGEALFTRLRELAPTLQVILVTAEATVDAATRLMKRGAFDYLEKPFSPLRLVGVVESALLETSSEGEEEEDEFESFRQRIEAEYQKQVEFQKWIADKREAALKDRSVLLGRLKEEQESIRCRLERVQQEKLAAESLLSEEREAKHLALEVRDQALRAARENLEKQEVRFERLLLASEERTRETLKSRKELEGELADRQAECSRLEGELAERQAECSRLEGELGERQNAHAVELAQMETALSEGHDEIRRSAAEVEGLSEKLFKAEDRLDEKDRLLQSVEKRCARLETELEAQRELVEKLEAGEEELRTFREKNEALLADFDAHKEAILQERVEHEARLAQLRGDLAEGAERIARWDERNQALQEDVARLEGQLADKQTRMEELAEALRVEELRVRSLDATRDGAEARSEAMELRIAELEEELEKAENAREDARLDADRLRESTALSRESAERVAELESALDVQRRHNEGLRKRLEHLETECRSVNEAGDGSRKRVEEVEKVLQGLRSEKEDLQKALAEAREQARHAGDLTERLDSSRADRAELARRLHEAETRLQELGRSADGDGDAEDAARLAAACRKLQDRVESFELETKRQREELARASELQAEQEELVDLLKASLQAAERDGGGTSVSSKEDAGAVLSLLEGLPFAAMLLDGEGRLRWVGAEALALFGLSEGQPLRGVAPESLEALGPVAELQAALREGAVAPVLRRFTLAHGGMQGARTVEGRAQPISFEGDEAVLLSFRDVSELTRALDRIEHGRHMVRFGERAARDLDKLKEGLGSMRVLVEMLRGRTPDKAMVEDFAAHLLGEIEDQTKRVDAVYRRRDGEEETT